jgi:hypothetical protein
MRYIAWITAIALLGGCTAAYSPRYEYPSNPHPTYYGPYPTGSYGYYYRDRPSHYRGPHSQIIFGYY